MCEAYPQDQNERGKWPYSVKFLSYKFIVITYLVVQAFDYSLFAEMFSLFLLIGNFDVINNFWYTCGNF